MIDTTCITAELNGLLFDGDTADGDGVVYSWQDIAGWWDSPDLGIVTDQRPVGVSESVVNMGGRSITLTCLAHDPLLGHKLGLKQYKAIRTVKTFCGLEFVSGLLKVNEPGITLQSRVRLSSPIRTKRQAGVSVQFQVPLLAPDPRRYDATPQTVASSGSFSATNNGDLPTPPVLTVVGPATNVSLRNSSLANTPFVRFNGSIAGGAVLTIDFANLTANVDGLNVLSLLDGNLGGLPDAGGIGGGPPAWFDLLPGANALHQGGGGSGQIDFADAYR